MLMPLTRAAPLALLVAACHPALDIDRMRAHPDVLAVLRAQGEVAVMIALVPPAQYGDPAADVERVRVEIAAMQADVLASLDSADYRNRQRFVSVPALAGTLLSERGLRLLLAHRFVRRVDPDPGGGGTR